MTISRRELGAGAAALLGGLTLPLPSQSERATPEGLRAALQGQVGRSIFDDEAWLALLRRAVELNAETGALLRDYELSADAEPAITFVRY